VPKAKAVNHRKQWTEEELETLKREYAHHTGAELAEMLGRGKDSVYVYCSRLGLSKRKAINGHFFDEWSPEMAWVLGFWVADGSATNADYQYMVGFWQKERKVLGVIKRLLESDHALSKHNNRQAYALKTFSKDLYDGLATQLSFPLEAKSLHTAWPIDMPDEYARHFCRGLVDGDGYLGWSGDRPQLNLASGSLRLLEEFTEHVYRLTGVEGHIYKGPWAYSYIVNCTKAKCLADWMYANCGPYCLERKQRVYKRMLKWTPKQIFQETVSPRMERLFPEFLITKG